MIGRERGVGHVGPAIRDRDRRSTTSALAGALHVVGTCPVFSLHVPGEWAAVQPGRRCVACVCRRRDTRCTQPHDPARMNYYPVARTHCRHAAPISSNAAPRARGHVVPFSRCARVGGALRKVPGRSGKSPVRLNCALTSPAPACRTGRSSARRCPVRGNCTPAHGVTTLNSFPESLAEGRPSISPLYYRRRPPGCGNQGKPLEPIFLNRKSSYSNDKAKCSYHRHNRNQRFS